MIIASRHNPTVKEIRALGHRKDREERGLFFVEGIRIVAEAVELQAPIETVVVAPELLTSPFAWETVQQVERTGVPVLQVTPEVFRSLSVKEGPQGIGAVIRQRWESPESIRPGDELCWVGLEAVADPGNLGTTLRTGDAVGAAGVILIGPTTDPYDPTALRASMGAIFCQRLIRTTAPELTRWKHQVQYPMVGTSNVASIDYRAARYTSPLVLLMGSEREGLSHQLLSLCDELVRIPMVGRSDSLNLSVATAVVLYEIFNQRNPRRD